MLKNWQKAECYIFVFWITLVLNLCLLQNLQWDLQAITNLVWNWWDKGRSIVEHILPQKMTQNPTWQADFFLFNNVNWMNYGRFFISARCYEKKVSLKIKKFFRSTSFSIKKLRMYKQHFKVFWFTLQNKYLQKDFCQMEASEPFSTSHIFVVEVHQIFYGRSNLWEK